MTPTGDAVAQDGLVEAIQAAIDGLALNPRHALVFALCGAGLLFESLNLQLMSFVAPMLAREWRIGPALMGAAISAAIFGMLAGTYLFGALADRIGRRPAFQLTVGIFSALTALSGISASFWQLVAARFGAGLGIGGSIPVETAVLAEFAPARWRGRLMALWAMALPLGAFLAPFCVAAMPAALGWRGLLFLGGAPAVLVLLLRRTIPETPAYLAGRGRTAEAMRALRWIAGRPVSVPAAPTSAPARAAVARISPERLLFAEGYRESTIMSWLLYFGSFFAYYGFVLWLPALLAGYRGLERAEVLRFVATVAAAGFVGRAGVLLLADRVHKPTLIAGCSMLGSAALAAFALQTGHSAMLAWACAAAFCLEGTFSVLIPFVADLYPAQARATGVGWAGGAGRVAMALAPLAIGSLVEVDVRLSILLLAGASLSVAAVILASRRVSTRP